MRLRPATKHDQKTIRTLVYEGQINPFGLRWQNFVLAIVDSGEVVGVGQLKPHRGGVIELASIAVRPAYQGQGVAHQIIEHLLAQADQPVWLMCADRLTSFYEPFGFVQVTDLAAMPVYYRRVRRGMQLLNLFVNGRLAIMVNKHKPEMPSLPKDGISLL